MRKSIFLTVFLTLGLGATIYAQNLGKAVTCPGIQTLNCSTTADPLHPVPGVEYDYKVQVTPNGGTFHWFVTTNPEFIKNGAIAHTDEIEQQGGNIILATGTGYNDPQSKSATQKIEWKAEPETGKDLFLVMHYTDATDCAADNLKVYKIEMKNNFAIDVYTVDAATSDTQLGDNTSTQTVCSPKTQSAKYENGEVVYDYGTTYLYYVVAAGNFVNNWDLQFKLNTTLDTKQTVSVDWSNDGLDGWDSLTANDQGVYSTTVTGETGFNKNDCIVVRVTIANTTFEALVNQTVTLLADATSNGKNDVKTDCGDADEFAKKGTQTITPRPTVTNETDGGNFIPAK